MLAHLKRPNLKKITSKLDQHLKITSLELLMHDLRLCNSIPKASPESSIKATPPPLNFAQNWILNQNYKWAYQNDGDTSKISVNSPGRHRNNEIVQIVSSHFSELWWQPKIKENAQRSSIVFLTTLVALNDKSSIYIGEATI